MNEQTSIISFTVNIREKEGTKYSTPEVSAQMRGWNGKEYHESGLTD